MKRWPNTRVTVALAVALAAVVVLADGQPAGDVEAAPASAGLRAYLDPQTGRIVSRPTDPESDDLARSPGRDRLNTYSRDLVQERLPGGGFKVDLRGRFQSSVVATIDPETDEVTIDCVSASATAEARDER